MNDAKPRNLASVELTAMRNELREARERVLKDAEGFEEIIHVVERLGVLLTRKTLDLRRYENDICALADTSPLAAGIQRGKRSWHMPFRNLYALVRQARNDAVHQGAYARHLTEHVVQLCIVLEDALMVTQMSARRQPVVADFMVREVFCAQPWEPISFVRQRLLTNSFTYLPIFINDGWHLLADFAIARFLRPEALYGDAARTRGHPGSGLAVPVL